MSVLVIPIALTTLVKVIRFAHLNRNLQESLPYILLQFNISFVWICAGVFWLYDSVF